MGTPSYNQTSHIMRARIASALIVSLFVWTTGMPGFFSYVYALQVQTFSDTLSTSKPGVDADHTIVFTAPSGVPADGSSITIHMPTGFDVSAITHTDIAVDNNGTPLSIGASCGAVHVACKCCVAINRAGGVYCGGRCHRPKR